MSAPPLAPACKASGVTTSTASLPSALGPLRVQRAGHGGMVACWRGPMARVSDAPPPLPLPGLTPEEEWPWQAAGPTYPWGAGGRLLPQVGCLKKACRGLVPGAATHLRMAWMLVQVRPCTPPYGQSTLKVWLYASSPSSCCRLACSVAA
jgi:hypothetical protein